MAAATAAAIEESAAAAGVPPPAESRRRSPDRFADMADEDVSLSHFIYLAAPMKLTCNLSAAACTRYWKRSNSRLKSEYPYFPSRLSSQL